MLKETVAEGYKEIDRKTWPLDSKYGSFELKSKRGHCYGIGFAFNPGAYRTIAVPLAGPTASYRYSSMRGGSTPESGKGSRRLFMQEMDGVNKRAGFAELFCALVDETVPMTIGYNPSSSKEPPIGFGDMVFAVYERTLGPAEAKQQICDACQPNALGCGKMIRSACVPSIACHKSFNISPVQCKD